LLLVHHQTVGHLLALLFPLEDRYVRLWDGGVLLGQRRKSEVRLDSLEVGEQLPGLLVLDDGCDDDVVAWNPL